MLQYEEWRAIHRARCSQFYCEPTKERAPSARFDIVDKHGLNMASVRCTIDKITRSNRDVRRDEAERYFLICQIGGEVGVRHRDHDELLKPGEFFLGDSTLPIELLFEGKEAELLSLSIPRSTFLADGSVAPMTGKKVTSLHPLHASLRNLIVGQDSIGSAGFHADYLLDFITMVFGPDPSQIDAGRFRNKRDRMRYATQVIDQRMTDPTFSIDQCAILIGRSRRQLQRDFMEAGTSFTELLQSRRLHHFLEAGRRASRLGEEINIGELAYRSGFNDLSHFNRVFHRHFDAAPREILYECL